VKTRNLLIFGIVVLLLMIAEWCYVAWQTEVDTARRYHGLCNVGVGQPYGDFIHQLRLLQESGDTNRLARALRAADERSGDIYNVWLANKPTAYSTSIHEILK
jgi:hypothetical protein